MTDDLDILRALAERVMEAVAQPEHEGYRAALSAFNNAANPPAILALIERVRKAEGKHTRQAHLAYENRIQTERAERAEAALARVQALVEGRTYIAPFADGTGRESVLVSDLRTALAAVRDVRAGGGEC